MQNPNENEAKTSAIPRAESKPTPELSAGPSFTPAPWKVETPRDRDASEGGCSEWDESYPRGVSVRAAWETPRNGSLGYQICKMSGVHGNTLNDARLIAAAPALYEALKEIADKAKRVPSVQDRSVRIIKQTCAYLADVANEALALVDAH